MTLHIPVMIREVLSGLHVRPQGTYWDGTFGGGGHSELILQRLGSAGRLVASDRDEVAAKRAELLKNDLRFRFLRGSLSQVISQVPQGLQGFLWDVGCSTDQLRSAERGFSFREDGPLDMRMDREGRTTAADLVNSLAEKELADLIYRFGEERLSRRIAARIVVARTRQPILRTRELADICKAAYPRRHHRIDPATRTFQALRIAINDELSQLSETLPKALAKLAAGGRAVVISFHSLEDRIVKHCFREFSKKGGFEVLTKRPLVPEAEERESNPAARSSKLRVLMRLEEVQQ